MEQEAGQGWRYIPKMGLGRGVAARVELYPTHAELYDAVASHLADLIVRKRRSGRKAVAVLPVGPLPFRELAERFNERGVSCADLVAVLMDEYCQPTGELIPAGHPLSLRGCFRREFLDVIREAPPEENVIFPEPEDLGRYRDAIDRAGGVDVAYTGFGINGHWAFNEPAVADDDLEVQHYRQLGTRPVELACATIVQMAVGGTGGDLLAVPPRAVTIGPRELLSAAEIYCLGVRSWHSGVLRRALHGPVTPRFPASLVQLHSNLTLAAVESVAELPETLVLQRL